MSTELVMYYQMPNPSLKRKSKGLRPFDFRLASAIKGARLELFSRHS